MSFSENLINIFDAIGKQFGIVFDWTNKNVLPYITDLCNRLVSYELITSIAWLIFAIICIVLCFIWCKKGKQLEDNCDDGIGYFMISAIVGITTIVNIGVNINDILLCLTIPEKIIMYYVEKLM